MNLSVPPMYAPMTYTLPVTTPSDTTQGLYVLAVAMAATETSDTNLNLVSGSIDVAISSREEFRGSLAMILVCVQLVFQFVGAANHEHLAIREQRCRVEISG